MTPLKTIRAKCLDCTGGERREVRLCTAYACPLWPYRMGKRPEHPEAQRANQEARAAEQGG